MKPIRHSPALRAMLELFRLSLLFVALALNGCGSTANQFPKPCGTDFLSPKMVRIPAGTFLMGEDPRYAEEGPPRTTRVEEFWMDATEVTNAEFTAFVEATGYKTAAERDPPTLPGAPPEMLVPGSAVFTVPSQDDPRWWRWVVGAQWRHPAGPSESIAGKEAQPVVQIAYEDAEAYARWKGKELPTEEQWEYAARGGAAALPEPLDDQGKPRANYYQGAFPAHDLGIDGFKGRSPVGCFKANGYGLYDMIGNVWEWTRDNGGSQPNMHVIKGGSYLCAASYCARYRPSARQFQERDLGTNHLGFRLVSSYAP